VTGKRIALISSHSHTDENWQPSYLMAESRSIPNDFRKQMIKHSTENVITGLSTVLKKNIL